MTISVLRPCFLLLLVHVVLSPAVSCQPRIIVLVGAAVNHHCTIFPVFTSLKNRRLPLCDMRLRSQQTSVRCRAACSDANGANSRHGCNRIELRRPA